MLLSPLSLANGGVAVMVTLIANIVIHILFAAGVYRFAQKGEVEGRRTWFVGPQSA
ncbi:hypothetical protein [Ferrimonas sp. YFM]|uniref:hypothetical protein n=1 Tax=Ferrimonas sp. YFM TaxID=3028878 RepID=UPI0025747880|nr:hypothetical protein [Ferrimonas sp. YFM]BDY04574.1 hypothetical protein F0521_16150 [Ferrimonas sp. YFM]